MIEKLFDFILSNIWILIILVFFFRMRSKSTKQEKESMDHTGTMEQEVFSKQDYPEREETYSESKKVMNQSSSKKRLPDSPQIQQLEETVDEVKVTVRKKRSQKPAPLNGPMEGMIWSEVFGPPRSKNPHSRRRR